MPTTLNGDCCVELMQGTLVRPLPRYPGSVAFDDPLKVASNRVRTTLLRNAAAGDTLMTVSDGSRIVPQMLLSIDSEIVSVSAVSDNILTVIRGFDGTQPCSHSAGTTLAANIVAWHHNVLAAEITAIETALGPNLSNITGASGTISSNYDFSAQQPGGSLIAGLNVVTLTPVPQGVNGANPYHYLYVSGGTGTAEACLITGGTAVPGAASGTVIISCAGPHSGAWTIRSATAGIQEAIYSVGTSGTRVNVQLPPSTLVTYAPVTVIGQEVCVFGYGQATVIRPQHTSGRVFYLTAPGNFPPGPPRGFRNTLQNFQIVGPGTGTLVGIELRGQLVCRITDVAVDSTDKGIWVNDGTDATTSTVYIHRCMLWNQTPATGVAFQQDGGADIFLFNNHLSSNAARAGILLVQCLGTKIMFNEVYNYGFALLMQPGTGNYVHAVESNSNWLDSSVEDAWRLEPVSTGRITEIRSTNDRPAGSIHNGIAFANTTDINCQAVIISNALVTHNGSTGIYYGGGKDCEFNGCHVFDNSRSSSAAFNAFTAAPGASGFAIHGGTYASVTGLPGEDPSGGGLTNFQGWGIMIQDGASNNFIIEGVNAYPNVTGAIYNGGTGPSQIIRNNINCQNNLTTASIAAGVLQLGGVIGEARLVSGTATVTDIQPGCPGQRVALLKNDPGTITFTPSGRIHNAKTLGQNEALIAEFVSTKWILFS